ncbi:MAG: hypothetical protein IMF08_11410 [Proteobacteria bacterium]|nr:hypothetical protein [Pseudomonadota bacterium]
MADIGVSGKSRAEVLSEAKQYVDDIYLQDRIEPLSGTAYRGDFFDSYGGLGFYEKDTDEFQEASKYLTEKRKKTKEDRYPVQASELLKEMKSDPELYFRRLNVTNSNENIYCDIPVLASTDPETFVTTLLGLHPKDQYIVLKAFRSRYDHSRFDRELATEKPWLETVRDKILEAAEAMPPIGKYRLIQNVKWNIAPALGEEQQ